MLDVQTKSRWTNNRINKSLVAGFAAISHYSILVDLSDVQTKSPDKQNNFLEVYKLDNLPIVGSDYYLFVTKNVERPESLSISSIGTIEVSSIMYLNRNCSRNNSE